MRVELADQLRTIDLGPPLARGGEAAVYAVPGDPHALAKVYTDGRPETRADKVRWMIGRGPWDPPGPTGNRRFAWPQQLVRDPATKAFLGFVMPRVPDAAPLFEVANPVVRPDHAEPYEFRLGVARSLAAVVTAAHKHGLVVGDLNESNLLVDSAGRVTLIDADSVQVRAGRVVHRCLVGKGEYTPPELHGAKFADTDRAAHHDGFGLAVLVYQVLAGCHPFAGRFTGPGRPPALHEAVRRGLWPHAAGGRRDYLPPRYGPPFGSHPAGLRALWQRSFVDGHRRPEGRPTAKDWVAALDEAVKQVAAAPPPVAPAPVAPALVTPALVAPALVAPAPATPAAATTPRGWLSRPRTRWAVAAAVLLAAGGTTYGLLGHRDDLPAAPPPRPGLPNPAVWDAVRDPRAVQQDTPGGDRGRRSAPAGRAK